MELTGDFTPDMKALLSADIIISTPEKWDGISRNWHSRSYVKKVRLLCMPEWSAPFSGFSLVYSSFISFWQVGLMIIDEIHLLGGDRGPILEVKESISTNIDMKSRDI